MSVDDASMQASTYEYGRYSQQAKNDFWQDRTADVLRVKQMP
jgi:hypothetical protein